MVAKGVPSTAVTVNSSSSPMFILLVLKDSPFTPVSFAALNAIVKSYYTKF
ncbi:hypothetical protein DPMN_132625 [Dreissena polymorpha]|uniref:Uncharacterized protein n=1 Tax=Dreissena polymorpha TaxID=45954 RepID=A0A9D4FWH6_DREPO|nr:hypothetical protein DPMN_132625 [Dreissena polymorpha]